MFEAEVLPEGLAAMPPGHELSAAIGTMDLARCGSADLFTLVEAQARQVNFEQARLGRIMLEAAYAAMADTPAIWRNKRTTGAVDAVDDVLVDGEGGPRVARCRTLNEFCGDQLGFALKWPKGAATGYVLLTRDLVDRFPSVFAAFEAGRLDLARARAFSECLADVSDETAHRIVDVLLPVAERLTPAVLHQRLRYRVMQWEPSAVRKRFTASIAERRVHKQMFTDGTAELAGTNLPPDRAAAAYDRIDRIARAAKASGDLRRLAQLRADVMVDLLSGRPFDLSPSIGNLTAAADQQARDLGLYGDSADEGTGNPPSGEPRHRPGKLQPRPRASAALRRGRGVIAPTPRPPTNPAPGSANTGGGTASDNIRPGPGDPTNNNNDLHRDNEPWPDDDPRTDADPWPDSEASRRAGDTDDAPWPAPDDNWWSRDSDPGPWLDNDPWSDSVNAAPSTDGGDSANRWSDNDRRGGNDRWSDSDRRGDSDRRSGNDRWSDNDRRSDNANRSHDDGGGADPAPFKVASDDPRMCVCGGVQPAPRRGVVDLHAQLSTIMGLNDNPGLIPGWGPILAEIARDIAHDQETNPAWKYSACDERGNLTNHAYLRRRPNATERDFVRARDEKCCGPGCEQPSRTCDQDHHIEWAKHGVTHRGNLETVCRHHHRLRHECGFTIHRMPDGGYAWQAPNGHVYPVPRETRLHLSIDGCDQPLRLSEITEIITDVA